jgi:hypothetical protein
MSFLDFRPQINLTGILMTKRFMILSLFVFANVFTNAQSKDESWKVFDDSQVARIDVTMDSQQFAHMYANPRVDTAYNCRVSFRNKYIDTVFTNVGIAIRGNSSRDAKKKSIKISLNEFEKGKDLFGIEKLNINGEHNDPSIFRSKLCWEIFKSAGLTGSRAAHAALYINGEYLGLYISVEMIDEEFIKKNYADNSGNLWKCLYPGADLTYKGSDPNVYKYRTGFTAYELTTNETDNDYSKLVKLIDVVNNTATNQLADSLEKILDVANILKYEAMNILVGQWDDYWANQNNYYLYYEPSEKKFHIIPYDYDNTFGVDWFFYDWTKSDPYNFYKITKGNRPLVEKILAIPKYRDLYTHFLKFYTENVFILSKWNSSIDRIKNLITPYAYADLYKAKDYRFTNADFDNSYSETNYVNQHVKKGIKQFINQRNADIIPRLVYQGSGPIVYKVEMKPHNPGPNDSIYVYISGFGQEGIDQVNLQFHPGMLTVIYTYKMKLSPVAFTTIVEEADRWIGVIPPLGKNGFGRVGIEIKDLKGVTASYPLNGLIELHSSTGSSTLGNNVVINEFLADNTKTIKDPANTTKDEYDDWIELYNPTSKDILLTGMYLSDSKSNPVQWQFKDANTIIKPNEHIAIWCDDQTTQTGFHTDFKLSKSGECISIVDKDGKTIIDEYTFDAQTSDISTGRYPDGGNVWGKMIPSPSKTNSVLTGIEDTKVVPANFRLEQNYPNPFNPGTVINYQLSVAGHVTLKVYDLLGREAANLVDEYKQPGNYNSTFLPKASLWDKSQFPSGIYFYTLTSSEGSITRKMILLK